jgi:pantoate kinase
MAVQTAYAKTPGNVSCIFQVIPNSNPALMHSLGVGFTVDKWVSVSASYSKKGIDIFLNGVLTNFPTVQSVIEKMTDRPLQIKIVTDLSISCGFGVSGGAALATGLAINELISLGLTRLDIGMIAHLAEVENLTGLGDVCGQLRGGVLIKNIPGHPLECQTLIVDPPEIVHIKVYGPLSTKTVLSSPQKKESVNIAGATILGKISAISNLTFATLTDYSLQFALQSSLLLDPRVKNSIDYVIDHGGNASMIMLGHAVFSTIEFPGSTPYSITTEGAKVIN